MVSWYLESIWGHFWNQHPQKWGYINFELCNPHTYLLLLYYFVQYSGSGYGRTWSDRLDSKSWIVFQRSFQPTFISKVFWFNNSFWPSCWRCWRIPCCPCTVNDGYSVGVGRQKNLLYIRRTTLYPSPPERPFFAHKSLLFEEIEISNLRLYRSCYNFIQSTLFNLYIFRTWIVFTKNWVLNDIQQIFS